MYTTPLKIRRRGPSLAQPLSAASRIVKKLVLRGQAHSNGARYSLYLKVTVPAGTADQSYALLPDVNIKLIHAEVDALTSTGGYPPLQESAARAAGYLGIPMSSTSATTLDHLPLPRVTTANYAITLNVPTLPVEDGMSSLSYLISLEVETDLAAQPPRSPYTLRLPVPRCLHSRIHFTFPSEVLDSDEVQVMVDPPLGPRARRGRKSLENGDDDGRSTTTAYSEDSNEVEESEDGEEDAHVVRGLFPSTDTITLRWNQTRVGKLHPDDELPSLMCDAVTTENDIAYTLLQAADGTETVRLEARMKVQIEGPFSPGVGSPLCFPLILDTFEQSLRLTDVEVQPFEGLKSWHLVGGEPSGASSASHTPTQSKRNSALLVSLEEDSDNTMDLLATRPPKELDASLDLTNDVTLPLQSSSSSSNRTTTALQAIVLHLETDVCSESGRSLYINVRYCLDIELSLRQDSSVASIPLYKIPTAYAHRALTRLRPTDAQHTLLYASRWANPSDTAQTTALDYESFLEQDPKSPSSLETCYLHRMIKAEVEEDPEQLLSIDIPAQENPSPVPVRSAGVVRPMPLYDAITLHDDESSLPSTIASLSLTLWLCEHTSGSAIVSPRILAHMESSWPAMYNGRQVDEVDIWLPRLEAQGAATVRYAEVDGRRVEPTKSEGGESLCLHVRKPALDDSKEDVFARRLLIVFEYPSLRRDVAVATTPSSSTTATATTATTPLPVPLLSHEVISMQVSIHHATRVSASNTSASGPRPIIAPEFDYLQHDVSRGCTTLQKSTLPALTPLDLLYLPPSQASSDTDTRGRKRASRSAGRLAMRGARWIFFLSLLVAILSLWSTLQDQLDEMLRLGEKVQHLGYAANVDFRESSWMAPEAQGGGGGGEPSRQANKRGAAEDLHDLLQSSDPLLPEEQEEEEDPSPAFPPAPPVLKPRYKPHLQRSTSTSTTGEGDPTSLLPPSARRGARLAAGEEVLRLLVWPLRALGRGAGVVFRLLGW